MRLLNPIVVLGVGDGIKRPKKLVGQVLFTYLFCFSDIFERGRFLLLCQFVFFSSFCCLFWIEVPSSVLLYLLPARVFFFLSYSFLLLFFQSEKEIVFIYFFLVLIVT